MLIFSRYNHHVSMLTLVFSSKHSPAGLFKLDWLAQSGATITVTIVNNLAEFLFDEFI